METVWVPVSGRPGLPQNCVECDEPMLATQYVHRNHNDKRFCSAVCCVAYYLLWQGVPKDG